MTERYLRKYFELAKDSKGYGFTPHTWTLETMRKSGCALPEEATYFSALGKDGLFIQDVKEGSSAAKAGLRCWDLIVSVNEQSVEGSDYSQIVSAIKETPSGQNLALAVLRPCLHQQEIELLELDSEQRSRMTKAGLDSDLVEMRS